jgi:hypothetical protein
MKMVQALIALLLFQTGYSEEMDKLYKDKTIEQICDLPLEEHDFELISNTDYSVDKMRR